MAFANPFNLVYKVFFARMLGNARGISSILFFCCVPFRVSSQPRKLTHSKLLTSFDFSLMLWFQIFQDGPEYEARRRRGTFTPPNLSLKQLHDAVPRHLHEKSTLKSLSYVIRHIAFTFGFYYLATFINISTSSLCGRDVTLLLKYFVRPSLWILYWGWQGITFAGIWCLGTFKPCC